MGCMTMLPVVGNLSILLVCTLLASMAEGSGFLNWAFDGQQQSPANSSTTNPLVFTAQATSAFSDIVVVVARINVTDNGTQPVTLGGANHPFGLDESGHVVSYAAYKFNSLYYGESLITNSSAYPQAPLTTPWNSVTILHYVATASDPTVMDRLCFTSQTNLPSTIYCGILLAVTADVVPGPSQSTVPVEGVTPFVWVQNPIPRRAFTNSPDVVNAPYIPLVPTVDANNKALEGVVPWKCGRIVSDSGAGGSSTDCTIRSPEENTPMHRGCNPPLGTSMNTHVSTTVALTWNETVYLFRPLEFAVRTLSCLDPDVDTPPSQCYNFSDLIYIVPKGAAWGFLQMTYPQSAKLPPWIFLDATPLVTSQCLLYVSGDHSPGGIVLYDLATQFNGSATFLPVGILTPPDGPPNRTCTPSITTALVDVIYSVNVTGKFAELGVGLTDGLFTTASTLFVTLCGGSADFYVVSPTVAYMQQAPASAAGPFVLQHAGMVTVPYPEGFAGADSPNAFAVSATRHGTLSRVKEGAYISKTAYNTLATSCMYTIALAVPSTGYRGASAWAKANNKTYGAELDSYVSVMTAMSSYVLGFEATVGGVGGGDILGDGFSLTHTVVQSTFYSILDAHRTDTTTVLLDPKDYYASLNATKEFCQYGPCEVAVPVRDRITAVIGFSQLQQLPPVAQNELLSAEVVMKAVCGGDLP